MFTKKDITGALTVEIDQSEFDEPANPQKVFIMDVPELGAIKGMIAKTQELVWFAPCEVTQILLSR